MALALTCTCGALLEVDDKFAGQSLRCPDCQQLLNVPVPEITRHRKVSGLAVLAFVVALATGLTLVGSVLGIVLGVLARQRVLSRADRLTGLGFAKAAIIVSAVGGVLSLIGLVSPQVLHLDAFLRELAWARKLDYT